MLVGLLRAVGGGASDRSSGTAAASATAPNELSALENAIGSRKDFAGVYKVKSQERLDIAGAHRLKVVVTVPRGLPHDVLEANMRHALLTAYSNAGVTLGALSVMAWAGDDTSGPFSAAMATFAPGGDWSSASDAAPLTSFSVKTEFAPGYFTAKPTAHGIGTSVTLANDSDGPTTVLVSRSATSWGDADAVVRVPNGTKAKVVSVKEFNGGEGRVTLRYEVEIATTRQRGWVHAYAVKP
ncbi:MAG: hypothetical protein KIT84_11020 [Labilithrix sp.]|nr:hypothetical protein [Labilithrix sp.]